MAARRTATRSEFYATLFVSTFLLFILEFIALGLISLMLGKTPQLGIVGGLGFPNLVLGHLMTDGLFRYLGISRSGSLVQAFKRTPGGQGDAPGDAEVVEVWFSRPFRLFVLIGTPSLALLCGLLSRYGSRSSSDTAWGIASTALFGSLAIAAWATRKCSLVLRADHRGVSGYSGPYSLSRSFVPWVDIATCEIVSIRDVFGKKVLEYPQFKDTGGRIVLKQLGPGMQFVAPRDRERLIQFVRARFPKKDDDFREV